MVLQHAFLAFSIAAILAPFSYYAGLFARQLKLPQISGYLLSGIVCGPYVLGILNQESVKDLNIIEGVCLSIIGLAAGAELDWASLAKARKQVLGITFAVCIASWIFCYITIDWLLHVQEVSSSWNTPGTRTAVATLGATLMMTRSPASAIAVLKEVDGKGPYSSLVMAVVVVKDLVVIIAYALNIELIRMVILPGNTDAQVRLASLLLPIMSVLLSMGIGALSGVLLVVVLRQRPYVAGPGRDGLLSSTAADSKAGPHGHNPGWTQHNRTRQMSILVLSSTVFAVAHYFDAEPLLACVTMGLVAINRTRGEAAKEELLSWVASIMSLTNVAFFGLAGASLRLSALKDLLAPALLLASGRVLSIYMGSWLGCYATGTNAEHRRVFWASMITQAGVALGLARLAGTRFPEWGGPFQTYMMAIILINLLIGPPLFRWSLIIVGEAKPSPSQSSGGAGNVLSLGGVFPHATGGVGGVSGSGLQILLPHTGHERGMSESQQYMIPSPASAGTGFGSMLVGAKAALELAANEARNAVVADSPKKLQQHIQ